MTTRSGACGGAIYGRVARVLGRMNPIVAACAFLLTMGCASPASEIGTQRTGPTDSAAAKEGGSAEAAPIEKNPITLTLPPFWEQPITADGNGTPIAIEGVNVCVKRRRAYGESWERFVPTDGPCTTTRANEQVVLPGVPALSEVILTAEKNGYVPRVIPLTTGQWDQDAASLDLYYLNLSSPEDISAMLPNADVLDKGTLVMFEAANLAFLPGVRVSLEPDGGAPVYLSGGKVVPDASATLSGSLASVKQYASVAFANLDAGEYSVRAERPGLECGRLNVGDDDRFGFADSRPGFFRVPVFKGHVTYAAGACTCLVPDGGVTCSIPGDPTP